MALKMKKSPTTPLECAVTKNRACKSFGIHSYKFKGLKLPWNDTLAKIPGWGGPSTFNLHVSVSRTGLRDTCTFLVSRMRLRDNSQLWTASRSSTMPEETQLDTRCQHTSAAGRRCRMPRMQGDASFCDQHRCQLQLEPHPEAVAAELLGSIDDFKTATAVNHALGRLF